MMFKEYKKERIRCDYCGRFIAFADLDSGDAYWQMSLPDSHCSVETWEGCCNKCNKGNN